MLFVDVFRFNIPSGRNVYQPYRCRKTLAVVVLRRGVSASRSLGDQRFDRDIYPRAARLEDVLIPCFPEPDRRIFYACSAHQHHSLLCSRSVVLCAKARIRRQQQACTPPNRKRAVACA